MAELKVNQVLVELGHEVAARQVDVNQMLVELAQEGTNRQIDINQIIVEVAFTPKRRYTAQVM